MNCVKHFEERIKFIIVKWWLYLRITRWFVQLLTPASVNAKIQSRTTIEKSDIKVCKQFTNYLQGFPQGWRLQRRLYEFLRIIKRKTNSENVSTPQSRSFERRIWAQTQDSQIFKSLICLKWIRKKFSTTLHTYIAGHSL